MTDATARYVIAADDKTNGAIGSIKRSFKDLDAAAKKLSHGLKGLGIGAVALKAWAVSARLGDEAIKNLAASNKAFADSVRESETAMRSAFSAGQLTIEAQTKLTAAFNDPAYVAAMRQSADLFGRLRLEMKALGPAWGIVIGKAAQWAGLVDKLSQLDSRGPLSRRAALLDLGDVDAAQKLGKSQKAAADALEKAAADAAKDLAKWNDDFNKAQSDLTDDAHDEIARVVGDTLETQQTFLGSSKQVFDEYLKGLQPVAKESFEQMSAYAADFARSIDGNIKQALLNMEGGFKGFAKSAIDSLRDVLAEIMSVKLRMAVFGNVDSSGNLSGGLLSGAFNSLFSFGGARAAGGPVDGGKSYLVGERGPELFTPARSGVITPSAGKSLVIHHAPVINVNAAQLTQDQAARMVADSQRRMWDDLDRRYGIA